MGYIQVRYDFRVVIYDHKLFIRLATALLSGLGSGSAAALSTFIRDDESSKQGKE